MQWRGERIELVEERIRDLPLEPAVYVLWREDIPIHAGFVTRLTQSLRDRLMLHLPLPGEDLTPGGPTHFTYFLSDNPIKHLGDVLPAIDAARQERDGKL